MKRLVSAAVVLSCLACSGLLGPDTSTADGAIAGFVAAVNGGDLAGAEAVSTAGCWGDPCKDIAEEAPNEFDLQLEGEVKVVDTRAIARLKAICEGGRECDEVFVYAEQTDGAWAIAWLDENEKHARDFIAGKAPAAR